MQSMEHAARGVTGQRGGLVAGLEGTLSLVHGVPRFTKFSRRPRHKRWIYYHGHTRSDWTSSTSLGQRSRKVVRLAHVPAVLVARQLQSCQCR